MNIIDFGFEREVVEEGGQRRLQSGILVSSDTQPPPKKPKVTGAPMKEHGDEIEDSTTKNDRQQRSGKQVESMV